MDFESRCRLAAGELGLDILESRDDTIRFLETIHGLGATWKQIAGKIQYSTASLYNYRKSGGSTQPRVGNELIKVVNHILSPNVVEIDDQVVDADVNPCDPTKEVLMKPKEGFENLGRVESCRNHESRNDREAKEPSESEVSVDRDDSSIGSGTWEHMMRYMEEVEDDPEEEEILVWVRKLNGELLGLEVSEEMKISEFVSEVQEKTGIAKEQFYLTFRGKNVTTLEASLKELDISGDSLVEMNGRLRGGSNETEEVGASETSQITTEESVTAEEGSPLLTGSLGQLEPQGELTGQSNGGGAQGSGQSSDQADPSIEIVQETLGHPTVSVNPLATSSPGPVRKRGRSSSRAVTSGGDLLETEELGKALGKGRHRSVARTKDIGETSGCLLSIAQAKKPELQSKCMEQSIEIHRLKERLDARDKDVQQLSSEVSRHLENYASSQETCNNLQQTLFGLEIQKDRLLSEIGKQTKKHRMEIDEVKRQVEDTTLENTELIKALEGYKEQLTKSKKNTKECKVEIDELREIRSAFEVQLQGMETHISEFKVTAKEAAEKFDVEKKAQSEEIKKLGMELRTVYRQLEVASKEKEEAIREQEVLREKCKSLQSSSSSVQAHVSEGGSSAANLLATAVNTLAAMQEKTESFQLKMLDQQSKTNAEVLSIVKVEDPKESKPKEEGVQKKGKINVKGVEPRSFNNAPDLVNPSTAGKALMDLDLWFDEIGSKVASMFPAEEIGKEFWTYCMDVAVSEHKAYLKLGGNGRSWWNFSMDQEEYYEDWQEEFSIMDTKVLALMLNAIPEDMKTRVISEKDENDLYSVAGILALLKIEAYDGSSAQRESIKNLVNAPTAPKEAWKVLNVVRDWKRQLRIVERYVKVEPDYGELCSQLTELCAPCDQGNKTFMFQRELYVQQQDIDDISDIEKSVFEEYLAFVKGLLTSLGSKFRESEEAKAKRIEVEAEMAKEAKAKKLEEEKDKKKNGKNQGEKTCWFFSKGKCQFGKKCSMKHDTEAGDMCYWCGARGDAFHKIGDCEFAKNDRAEDQGKGNNKKGKGGKGKGKGGGNTNQGDKNSTIAKSLQLIEEKFSGLESTINNLQGSMKENIRSGIDEVLDEQTEPKDGNQSGNGQP